LASGRGFWRSAFWTPPPKAEPENSQLEREEPGERSWKGVGPEELGWLLRAGGALGCHKVNGSCWGVAVYGEAHSLRESGSARAERPPGSRGVAPLPGRVPGPWPLPALQTATAAVATRSLPAAGRTVSA
jgi:hypothetical protein